MGISTAGRISVITPTYCEASNLPLLVESIAGSLSRHGIADYEIIVVDDDGPDNTKAVCQSLAQRYPTFRLVTRPGKRGLAKAIEKGIYEADGEVIVTMDADLSHDPAMIPLLVNEVVDGGVDIAVASRFIGNHRMYSGSHRVWGSKALNFFIRKLLRIPAKDVTGGFHAIRRDTLDNLDLDSIFQGHGDYSFALLYKGKEQGLKIKEIGYTYRPRERGVSKTAFLKSGFGYVIRAFKLRLGLERKRCRNTASLSPEYQKLTEHLSSH